MRAIFKIALRNILLNKKQSLRVGFAIGIATFIILVASSILNGVETQILKNYLSVQAGDVVVVWKDLKEVSNIQPGRLLFPERISFDVEDGLENKIQIKKLKDYLAQSDNVENVFYNIRYMVEVETEEGSDKSFCTFSMTDENKDWLLNHNGVEILQGKLVGNDDDGVCISKEKADQYELTIGDKITVKSVDIDKVEHVQVLSIEGIYANKASYENTIIFMSDTIARKISGYSKSEFDIARIYLKDRSGIIPFSKSLDKYLNDNGGLLVAEDYITASLFYTQLNKILKIVYSVFFVFVLFVIALGLRATVKINLRGRLVEFGTLRAIGYSKMKCYLIILNETLIIALIALILSLSICMGIILIFGRTGIYIGPGAPTYFFGSERMYPILRIQNAIFTFCVIFIFALMATLKPGFSILKQKIVNLLAKKVK